jgi:putative membrane-bound dehydrogenase-like protein
VLHFRTLFTIVMMFWLAGTHKVSVPGQPTNDSLYLPQDLEATLWAESPMFYNPTNLDVDLHGRVWVTEAVNYRNYNNKDTAFLHHPGGDRVMILEDTNSDGKADISKVFVQDKDLISPVGIAVIGNRVVVSCSPNVIVYTDSNGDDRPDTKEVFLTGFGGKDHDHSVHAFFAGADGNWYFNTGNAGPHNVADKSGFTLRSGSIYTGGSPYNDKNQGNMRSDDGKVWVGGLALRVRPDGTQLKVMGHNFRNSYEVFPDSYGNLWQNDNDDQVVACRTSWLMAGGNAGFFSSDGTRTWQADQRPGQSIFDAHWHQDDPGVMPAGDCTGAGSPTGVTMIEGDELGAHYRGTLLSADAGRNIIFSYKPSVKKSGFDLGKKQDFISSVSDGNERYVWNDSTHGRNRDKWFRPSDVTIGTDGALYIADWYDPVVGGHQMQDKKGYGRIYRVARKGRLMPPPVIDLNTADGQILALKSPAINVRHSGFVQLLRRGNASIPLLARLLNEKNTYIQARAIWLLSRLGDAGISEVKKLLKHPDEMIRATAYRALTQNSKVWLDVAKALVKDPSSFVRREVILSLADVDFQTAKPLLIKLGKQFDGSDRWYLEAFGLASVTHEEEMYNIMRNELEQNNSAVEWRKPMSMIAWRLHPASAAAPLAQRATSRKLSMEERDRAITAIAFIREKVGAETMLRLSQSADKEIASAARYWLGFRQNNDWANHLDWKNLKLNPAYERKLAEMKVRLQTLLDERQSDDERRWQSEAMLKDSIGAQMLLGVAIEKRLPQNLQEQITQELLQHKDAVIQVQAARHFAQAGNASSYDMSRIARLTANPAKGKQVFLQKCRACHVFNETASSIGPDLSGIASKFDDIELLRSIIDPDESIVFGYEPWIVNTTGNEAIYGFLVSDNNQVMLLKDLSGRIRSVPKDQIVSAKKQQKSIMPSAQANGLGEQELQDLISYLKSGRNQSN